MEKHRFDYFASCPAGLEDYLLPELKQAGADTWQIQRGGVSFTAQDAIAPLRLLLRSRVASRVFKLLYSFECHTEKSMYQELAEIKWKSILELNQTFRITTIYGKLPEARPAFTNSQFTTLKTKDAIVDWFNHNEGLRPSIDKENPDVSLLLRVDDAQEGLFKIQVLLDLCGNPLSQRGYRRGWAEAPVKENLAAGILRLLDWDPSQEAFLDGMCGSGTFVIEAALMAGNISPQFLKLRDWKRLQRPWAFLASQWFIKDRPLMEGFRLAAEKIMAEDELGFQKLEAERPLILGNDNNPLTIKSTRENLRVAGFDHLIPLSSHNAEDLTPKGPKCLFFCNPPYGERLMNEQEEDLKALYHGIGEAWKKNWKGHRSAVFTGNLPLLKSISLKSSRRIPIHNGDIDARVVEYKLY